MGATNFTHYTDNQIQIANAFKALGHPARIAIIELLTQYDQLNIKDLNSFIPLAQGNISRHCKELFNAGILGITNYNNNSFYSINIKMIDKLVNYLEHIYEKRGDQSPPPYFHILKNIVLNPKIRLYNLT